MDCGEPGIGNRLQDASGNDSSTAVQQGTVVNSSPADSDSADSVRIPTTTARSRFVPAVLLMAAVTLGLAWLAFTTANPVVISPPQIEEAACVIVGEVLKTAENRVKVISSLKGPLAEGTIIRVTRIPASLLQGERQWILALDHLTNDRFAIVVPDTRYETAPEALVYPANPQSMAEVQHWLKASWPTRDVPEARPAP